MDIEGIVVWYGSDQLFMVACIEKELKVREAVLMSGIREIAGYIIIFIFSILIQKWNDK